MGSIRTALEVHFKGQYWVLAEMNRLNLYQHSGHCYPELVEKTGGKVLAQARGILWKNDYDRINARFLEFLREPLKDGIKILFLCKVSFDPLHGLSLRILDIDPSYTLGDLEREKAESINQLKAEGVFAANTCKTLAMVPSRIAVISVESSKGFADFNRILDSKPSGFTVSRTLFPSILQGDAAVHSILYQLKQVEKIKEKFDAVAIIRGGGGEIGLSCYNNLVLARAVATFPLPIITGIGHATNETVVELVAHTNCITPTKVAEFILDRYRTFNDKVNELSYSMADFIRKRFREAKNLIFYQQKMTRVNAGAILQNADNLLSRQRSDIYYLSHYSIASYRNILKGFKAVLSRMPVDRLISEQREVQAFNRRLDLLSKGVLNINQRFLAQEERTVLNLHPDNVLKRGYAVIIKEGNIVTESSEVVKGDLVTTVMKDGAFISEVNSFSDKPGIFKQEL